MSKESRAGFKEQCLLYGTRALLTRWKPIRCIWLAHYNFPSECCTAGGSTRKKPCRIQTHPQASYSLSFSIQCSNWATFLTQKPSVPARLPARPCLCFLLRCAHEQMCAAVWEVQKRVWDALELEMPVVIPCLIYALRTELRSSERTVYSLNYWAKSPVPGFKPSFVLFFLILDYLALCV